MTLGSLGNNLTYWWNCKSYSKKMYQRLVPNFIVNSSPIHYFDSGFLIWLLWTKDHPQYFAYLSVNFDSATVTRRACVVCIETVYNKWLRCAWVHSPHQICRNENLTIFLLVRILFVITACIDSLPKWFALHLHICNDSKEIKYLFSRRYYLVSKLINSVVVMTLTLIIVNSCKTFINLICF